MTTLTQLVTRTQERLSLAGGIGVQIYAEDRIAEMIQHKFDVLFDEHFWEQFTTWNQWTLDGTLGIVTTDLTEIVKRLADVGTIFNENSVKPVTRLPDSTINPFEIMGNTAIHYSGTGVASSVFHVWPKASTGDLVVKVRTKPATFAPEDTVDFDEQLLILGAAYDYAEDDGTNPNATQKFKNLFDARVAQVMKSLKGGPVLLDPGATVPQTFEFTPLP